VRDLARLDPSTIGLWNGEKWTPLLGMSKSPRTGDEIELVLRSGERISCTPSHRFPTAHGLVDAGDLKVGDVLQTCRLPDSLNGEPEHIGDDAAWFAGLYLAEGSMSGDKIQIAGHTKEEDRWLRLQRIAASYGGSATRTVAGNNMTIRVYGKLLVALVRHLVSGRTARDKCFAPCVWRRGNRFVSAMLDGYLHGDGHYDAENDRWRLGFTRNYNLERDLRTACARLGYSLTLNTATARFDGRIFPTFKGEIRKARSGHFNERDRGEVVAIRRARCREVYDLGVADAPHVFALASGVLTHNSKPNPMPESVTDRPTKAHEQVFLLAKSARYFYDADAVREPHHMAPTTHNGKSREGYECPERADGRTGLPRNPDLFNPAGRNLRSVWTIATHPFPQAHFATFPPALVEPCIKAGTSEKGCCATCGAPWERVVEHPDFSKQPKRATSKDAHLRNGDRTSAGQAWQEWRDANPSKTTGFRPTCAHGGAPVPATVLDPFFGAGTVGLVADRLGRNCIGIELNPEYARMAEQRIKSDSPLFASVERS
jgi:DNA methylase